MIVGEELRNEFLIWMKENYNLSPITVKTYRSSLSPIDLESISDMKETIIEARENDEKSNTFKSRIVALKKLRDFLEEEYPNHEFIKYIEKLTMPSVDDVESYPPYSVDEARKIIKYLKREAMYKAHIFEIALHTGIRNNEIRQLNIGDIDLDKGILTVRKGKNSVYRKVVIHDIEPFKKWYMLRKHAEVKQDKIGDPWLYNSWHQRPFLRSSTILQNVRDETGIWVTLHRARAFYATELYKKTNDIVLVKNQMGHKSISTTQLYIHQFVDERVDKIRDVGRLF